MQTTMTKTGTEPAASPVQHLKYLDGLRALAALYVVAVHALSQVDRHHNALQAPWSALASLFLYGHYAVDVFIVLSGFCLMLPVVRRSEGGTEALSGGIWSFYAKRARRILPPYYLSMAITLLLIGTVLGEKTGSSWDTYIPVTLAGLLTHIVLVHDAFQQTAGQINGVYWSIAVEWRIYFVFPLLVVAWRRFGPLAATGMTVAAGYVILALLRHTPVFTQTNGVSPHYLGLFALGAFASGVAFSPRPDMSRLRGHRGWLSALCLMALIVLAATVLPVIAKGRTVPITVIDLFVGGTAMAGLILLSHPEQGQAGRRLLSAKPLVFLGTFAYSIYLIHTPFLQLFWQYVQVPLRLNITGMVLSEIFLVIPLILGISYLFYLGCERPFLTRRPRTAKRLPVANTSEAVTHA
jgi:peptidoglycan/LPS O-acetylase OafA/YrhL